MNSAPEASASSSVVNNKQYSNMEPSSIFPTTLPAAGQPALPGDDQPALPAAGQPAPPADDPPALPAVGQPAPPADDSPVLSADGQPVLSAIDNATGSGSPGVEIDLTIDTFPPATHHSQWVEFLEISDQLQDWKRDNNIESLQLIYEASESPVNLSDVLDIMSTRSEHMSILPETLQPVDRQEPELDWPESRLTEEALEESGRMGSGLTELEQAESVLNDPGLIESGLAESIQEYPGLAESDLAEIGRNDPGLIDSALAEPAQKYPELVEPRKKDPELIESPLAESGQKDLGLIESDLSDSGVAGIGNTSASSTKDTSMERFLLDFESIPNFVNVTSVSLDRAIFGLKTGGPELPVAGPKVISNTETSDQIGPDLRCFVDYGIPGLVVSFLVLILIFAFRARIRRLFAANIVSPAPSSLSIGGVSTVQLLTANGEQERRGRELLEGSKVVQLSAMPTKSALSRPQLPEIHVM